MGDPVGPDGFRFSSLQRASVAAKRLKSAMVAEGHESKPLGWYRNILAKVLEHRDWTALVQSVKSDLPLGILDHEIRDIDQLIFRRIRQAEALRRLTGIDASMATWLIDEVEPTGSGTGPLRVDGPDDTLALRYVFPPLPQTDEGMLDLYSAEARAVWNETTEYGCAFVLADYYAENLGFLPMRASRLSKCTWKIEVFEGVKAVASTAFSRYAIASLDEDEPRPLRPTEIASVRQEWIISECKLPVRGSRRQDIAEMLGAMMAMHMVQDLVWLLSYPRPPVTGSVTVEVDVYEEDKDQVLLGQCIADAHEFAMEIDEDNFREAEGRAYRLEPPLTRRIRDLCPEIYPLLLKDD